MLRRLVVQQRPLMWDVVCEFKLMKDLRKTSFSLILIKQSFAIFPSWNNQLEILPSLNVPSLQISLHLFAWNWSQMDSFNLSRCTFFYPNQRKTKKQKKHDLLCRSCIIFMIGCSWKWNFATATSPSRVFTFGCHPIICGCLILFAPVYLRMFSPPLEPL